ncbi:MAG: hypothetical protein NAOJABEB_02673 [Steroidobacteraceae bacterium]|nr:hypothetical protein [Steroidobacteraceae bacterium]
MLPNAHEINPTVAKTREGTRAMTPEYAGPEQAHSGLIFVASNARLLVALLYQLLTRQSPYRLTGATRFDYEQAVLEREPKRSTTSTAGALASTPCLHGRPPRSSGSD